MTSAQLASVIRFHLHEMGARNAHHEFEHLARYLARAKVHSNILPATGPVSAGGDGGKDFETFNTSVSSPIAATKGFSALSSGSRKVAFSCSAQQEGIVGKIEEDVVKALNGGPVDEVVYFCEANLPVAKRHALQKWAKATHKIELQVFDGNAISELLCDRDVFWIAQEYLHIPAEYMPPSADEVDWHRTLVAKWTAREPIIINNSDFAEIKAGLRRATFHDDARPKLLFWLGLTERFTAQEAPRRLQRAAIYEISVAWLRGKGNLTPQLERIRDYYSDVADWLTIADLQDAATLMVYCFSGWMLNHFAVDREELFAWRDAAMGCVDEEIAAASGPGRKAGLYRVKAQLSAVSGTLEPEPAKTDTFESWGRMLDEAEKTTLFPIEDFAAHLANITSVYGNDPRFTALSDRVDALIEKRGGPIASASVTFERAASLYEQDKLPQAIRALHRAQLQWFGGDTLLDFQSATYLLANCYLELGLCYAAKHTALAAAYIALHSDKLELTHTLPRMLFLAADADDAAGNSFSYLEMLTVALSYHCLNESDPLDFEKHSILPTNLGQAAALRGFAARSGDGPLALVDALLAQWPDSLRQPVVGLSKDPTGFWSQGTWDEAWAEVEDNFAGPPLGDVGPTRSISWRAFDVTWIISFPNNFDCVPLAEEFAAALQIALASLAGQDPCLVPTVIQFELSVDQAAALPVVSKFTKGPGDHGIAFGVSLAGSASADNARDTTAEVLGLIAEFLSRCSVLPEDKLLTLVEVSLLDAAGRLHMGRPYRELYEEFVPIERFQQTLRQSATVPNADKPFKLRQHEYLAPPQVAGPTYSRQVALENIRVRYTRAGKCIKYTLRNLMDDPVHGAALRAWHATGMLDWEILSIVANAAVNARHPLSDDATMTPEIMDQFNRALDKTEQKKDALTAGEVSGELLLESKPIYHRALLNGWQLRLSPAAHEPAVLEQFLVERYGLRSDDVDHADYFRW